MRSTGMSPVVEAWSTCRTSSAQDWPPGRLLQAKGQTTVSVVMPARDEEATVGTIATAIRSALIQAVPLVDEIIVVDSRSADGTAAAARAAGAVVVSQDDITRGLPPMHGKGDAMWAGLAVASGDIVAFIDADVEPFDPRFVTGLLGPLLTDPAISFVKGFYHRPLTSGGYSEPDGGGRVTELLARPLVNLFWPDLAGFVQPLAGETAGGRYWTECRSCRATAWKSPCWWTCSASPALTRSPRWISASVPTATRATKRSARWPRRSCSQLGRGSCVRDELTRVPRCRACSPSSGAGEISRCLISAARSSFLTSASTSGRR